jgi:hypothetical protein
MHSDFYLPEDPEYTILDSARDSVRFAHYCLEPTEHDRWRAVSCFVDLGGNIMHWHDFGDLEGPGWAANAVGGAYQLYAWGRFDNNCVLKHVALGLLDHVLEDGFLEPDGFIRGYRDTAANRFCLNFKHNSDWFCPGSMAKIALQMLWASDILPPDDPRVRRLRDYAPRTADWLLTRLQTPTDWYPRRCAPEGAPYPERAEGGPDPFQDGSADGLYIVWLLLELTERGLGNHAERVREKLDVIVRRGGIYGSINHDTYDADENVARAETFRLFRRAARFFRDPSLAAFAFENALAGLERFQMTEDRNGVRTKGLLYMEDSWDTAYLWENAEAALAYMEAYEDTGNLDYCCCAVTILRAIAKHHYGPHGFLTEGVDWNNHVGREHHIDGAEFGAIRYTEPLLNNLHHVEPALRYLERHVV